MRLITWNACRGTFHNKVPLLDSLIPDIAVIPEIARPRETHEHCQWFGSNPRQGLAVISSAKYRLLPIPQVPEPPLYVIPIQVEGPESFTLFAVWTIKNQPMSYIRAVASAIERYADLFRKGPVVMMGDFNANAIWDHLHPAHLNFSSVAERLTGHGMTSAYHRFSGEKYGNESMATFYLHRDLSKPFHIDYCFVPASWAATITSVAVGNHGDWQDHSDHMPLVVDL